ncbi:hypothetical protein J6590_011823 [Homalodisca vitripennis]|nr:hypothetical protein J6590_011823 [Homalodisca vitripennis]
MGTAGKTMEIAANLLRYRYLIIKASSFEREHNIVESPRLSYQFLASVVGAPSAPFHLYISPLCVAVTGTGFYSNVSKVSQVARPSGARFLCRPRPCRVLAQRLRYMIHHYLHTLFAVTCVVITSLYSARGLSVVL